MRRYRCALVAFAAAAPPALAQSIEITIENPQPEGQFYLTPFWLALHNGAFDAYDTGEFAGPGITRIAENGATDLIGSMFEDSDAGMAGGVHTTLAAEDGPDGAPVFAPGESASIMLDAGDPTVNRYLSYASMVVPSNDLFVGNDDPIAHEIFDADGNFTGPVVIDIFGSGVNDNGTEVNNAFGDAAFSANDGQSVAEFAPVRDFFTDDADADYLQSFVGTETAIGTTIDSTFGPQDLIARITIVPAPATGAAVGAMGLLALRRRR